ncbi:CBS domain-containing protein [Oscillospiraceae bacterium OttesenSCG-928-F05]|nr:CBS domain-containing protein [Oscillospiraceae bacterium OttesenSCG-928-F05]
MQVKELMNQNVVSISPDETASLAARLLTRHNVGALPVCDRGGKLRGIVTDRDIITRCVAAENLAEETRVREIMTRGVTAIAPESDVHEASRLMAAEQVRRLPVTEDGRLVGMLSLADLARTERYTMEASVALSEISSNVRKL